MEHESIRRFLLVLATFFRSPLEQLAGPIDLMKLSSVPVFGASVCALLLSQSSLKAQSVKVMQWSIHGTLGNFASNVTAGVQAMARIVNFNQPDILLFNELQDNGVSADQAAQINQVTAELRTLVPKPSLGPQATRPIG